MADENVTVAPASVLSVWRSYPLAMILALFGGAVLAAIIAYLALSAIQSDDEAPIRVRNGSLDFVITSADDQWEPVGGSNNWRYRDGNKQSDKYEVIVVPAGTHTCNLYSRQGTIIEFTYSDDTKVVFQSSGQNTLAKPGPGVTLTLNSAAPQILSYSPAGYLARVTVDNQTLCTFGNGAQLSSVFVVDVP